MLGGGERGLSDARRKEAEAQDGRGRQEEGCEARGGIRSWFAR
jgi:hypothetical protein